MFIVEQKLNIFKNCLININSFVRPLLNLTRLVQSPGASLIFIRVQIVVGNLLVESMLACPTHLAHVSLSILTFQFVRYLHTFDP